MGTVCAAITLIVPALIVTIIRLHVLQGSSEAYTFMMSHADHHPLEPAAQNSRLPIEVCERVIDWVAAAPKFDYFYRFYADRSALHTLRACSLVCTAWTPRTRLHLFRTLCVRSSSNSPGNIDDFAALLRRNPSLPALVTTVVAKPRLDRPSGLHTVALALPRLLPRLAHLRLSVGLFHPPPAVFAALRGFACVTRLSLHAVMFYSVHDLRRTVAAFRALAVLDLWCIEWHGEPAASVLGQADSAFCPHSPIRLEAVFVQVQRNWLVDRRAVRFTHWLARSGMLSSITNLCLEYLMVLDPAMLAAVALALAASAGSVKVARLSFGPDIQFSTRAYRTSLTDLKHYLFSLTHRARCSTHRPRALLEAPLPRTRPALPSPRARPGRAPPRTPRLHAPARRAAPR